MLVLDERIDLNRPSQRFWTEARILDHFECRTMAFGRRQRETLTQLAVRRYRDGFRQTGAGLWMPNDELVGSRRNLIERKSSVLIGQRIIRIVDGHGPAFHVRMKPALHIKRPPALRSEERRV